MKIAFSTMFTSTVPMLIAVARFTWSVTFMLAR